MAVSVLRLTDRVTHEYDVVPVLQLLDRLLIPDHRLVSLEILLAEGRCNSLKVLLIQLDLHGLQKIGKDIELYLASIHYSATVWSARDNSSRKVQLTFIYGLEGPL